MEINAPAKINLFLNVLNKRKDGYHNIETIFQTISLYDKINIYPGENFSVVCPPIKQEDNLAYKAGVLLMEYIGEKRFAKIVIEKNIPIASGLGGGSSDAASCLLGLNNFWRLGLSKDELKKIGERLGADVPYFIDGGTILGEGKGTKLKRISPLPDCFFVLAVFDFMVLAKEVYQAFKGGNNGYRKEDIISAIEKGSLEEISKNLYNSLEVVVFKKYPEVENVKRRLIEEGAMNALMSGSGPTVFGIVKDEEKAEAIKNTLSGFNIKTFVVKNVRKEY